MYSQKIKCFYEWLQRHIGVIIFLPTFIGGIWQLLELSVLGAAYIRFFSVSQLVSDGLTVCYILSWMTLMGSIQVLDKRLMNLIIREPQTTQTLNENVEITTDLKETHIFKLLIGIIVVISTIYFFLMPIIETVIRNQTLTISNLMSFSWYCVFLLIVAGKLWRLILSITTCKMFFLRNSVQNMVRIIGVFLSIGILILTIYFLRFFHNSFLMPSSFRNIDYIMCKIKRNNPGAKSAKIEYFNDKYIFIKLNLVKAPPKMEVIAFESLLDAESCTP